MTEPTPDVAPAPRTDGSAAADLLSTPPTEGDDLPALLASRRGSRQLPPLTTALAAALLLAVGVVCGAWADQRWGSSGSGSASGANARRAAFASAAARGGFGGFGGSGNGGSGAQGSGQPSASSATSTTGTVRLVDRGTVYVAVAGGGIVRVRLTGSTAIQRSAPASRSALRAGQKVTVQGAPASGGVVSATRIDISPGKATTR
jgi:hypothetical protein